MYAYSGRSYRGILLGERRYASIAGIPATLCKNSPHRGRLNRWAKSGTESSSPRSHKVSSSAKSTYVRSFPTKYGVLFVSRISSNTRKACSERLATLRVFTRWVS